MAFLTCHICNVSLLLGPSGVGFGGVIAALRRRTLAPVLRTAHREEGAGLPVNATEENAMTLLPRRGMKASLISLAIVATACSCGGGVRDRHREADDRGARWYGSRRLRAGPLHRRRASRRRRSHRPELLRRGK